MRLPRFIRNSKRYLRMYGLRAYAREGHRRLMSVTRPARRKVTLALFHGRNLLLQSKPIRVRMSNVTWLLTPHGETALEVWLGKYASHIQARFVLEHLRKGEIFLDIGSNSDHLAIAAGKKLEQLGDGRVYVCERNGEAHDLIKENIQLNRLGNVSHHHIALGDHPNQDLFPIESLALGSSATLGNSDPPVPNASAGASPPVTTVDAFVEINRIFQVHLMRINADGAELMVLKGAGVLLRRHDAPLLIYMSDRSQTARFNYHPVEVIWHLQDHGYRIFMLGDDARVMRREPRHGFDGTMIAVKSPHPLGAGFLGSEAL
jgi:FkbM family methyltransferase